MGSPAAGPFWLRASGAVAILAAALLGFPVQAGDILRGGAATSTSARRGAASPANAGAASAARAQGNARDRLARTTQSVDAMKALQAAARAAAGRRRLADPGNPGKNLPRVTDGLSRNGLRLAPGVPVNLKKPKKGEDPGLWVGADLPRQTTGRGGVDVTIVQTQQQAVLNWEKFNVGPKTTLTFDQSAGGSDRGKWIAFNKVNDPSGKPSQILGSIKADGQVYVINRNGIIFGGASQVNVHTLVASALPISDRLIAQGLLNNPGAEFLFDASRTESLLGRLNAATPAITLADRIDDRSTPVLTASLQTDKGVKTVTLSAKTDYTLTRKPGENTLLTLTADGLAKLGDGASPQAFDISYLASTGDVRVQKGATLASPTSAAQVGGRIMLVGANVENAGTISTPDGQAILAAGLQVGIAAHSSDDAAIRGLDLFVGAVGDAGSAAYAGRAINSGLVEIPRANFTAVGRSVRQNGAVEGTTTVSRNASVVLDATYDAVANPAYDASSGDVAKKVLFVPRSTGVLTLGEGSVMQILPDLRNAETIADVALPLPSLVALRGRAIHFDRDAALLAPSGKVTGQAGGWFYEPSASSSVPPKSTFVYSSGQIYFEDGALLDVSGSTDVAVAQDQSILSVELRGAQLADSPLQRDGSLRGVEITVDTRLTGTFQGRDWIGTPLGDARGFADLIERDVAQLTAAGGSVDLQAGSSFVLNPRATIDVSGGWMNNLGGIVKTTMLTQGSRLVRIEDATPDQLYDGIYDPKSTEVHAKWGITKTYRPPLALSTAHYEADAIAGAAGGSITIAAPAMALDGKLAGNTVIGPRQIRSTVNTTAGPASGGLTLRFRSQDPAPKYGQPYDFASPTPPRIVFDATLSSRRAGDFGVNADGATLDVFGGNDTAAAFDPYVLRADRRKLLVLSPDLVSAAGFGRLDIENNGGDIVVPAGQALAAPAQGSIRFQARNIELLADVTAPGGKLSFTANNISPYLVEPLKGGGAAAGDLPFADPAAGQFTLGAGVTLSTAGLVIDERGSAPGEPLRPVVKSGGQIEVTAFSATLRPGSLVDVSGGVFVAPDSRVSSGDAGSISILAGKDPNAAALFAESAYEDGNVNRLLAGRLRLEGELRGYSVGRGGSLSLQAPFVQVGGKVNKPGTLLLDESFFDEGGFTAFNLAGIGGVRESAAGNRRILPGLVITKDVRLAPRATSLFVDLLGPDGGLAISRTLRPIGERSPVSLTFRSLGFKDEIRPAELPVRGDLIVEEGAVLRTDPLGSLAFSGGTVTFLGSAIAPAGSIAITGSADSAATFNQLPGSETVRSTVYLGPESRLVARGTTVLTPDIYGRRRGAVLAGGSISVAGNIVAAAGSRLDVSGARGVLDLAAGEVSADPSLAVPVTSGLTRPLAARQSIATAVESDAGSITLAGGQLLLSDATLAGRAGGASARGGSLTVSSGRFLKPGETNTPLDVLLVVTQSGDVIPPGSFVPGRASAVGLRLRDADGEPLVGRGYFAADKFAAGDFDSLTLGGTVSFDGPVAIQASGRLTVGTGGVIYANDRVELAAPYVALGTALDHPKLATDSTNPFGDGASFAPTTGPGALVVRADLIDVGNLSLQGIRRARLIADGGDIRGAGTFDIAGKLYLRAGQIYPATATKFTLVAYDYQGDGFKAGDKLTGGSIRIEAAGSRSLPLSAGGVLSLYAANIDQGGVLRAPLGTINLGWDGTGTAPVDLIAGDKAPFPVTRNLALGSQSATSVSAVDPLTGQGLLIPYGVSLDGNTWIDPAGNDITNTGLPAKNISLSAVDITSAPSSQIDLRGGGDLYAYRWVKGNGGSQDVLAGDGSFAVIPNYDLGYAAESAFNPSEGATNLQTDINDPATRLPGYVNRTLAIGDRVYLGGSEGLPAGAYTLLPARYALLPGAFLVTPQEAAPMGTLAQPDGATFVSGYRFNGLAQPAAPGVFQRFEVAPAGVVRARSEYVDFQANAFLRRKALEANLAVPALPADSGHLVFQARESLDLLGSIASRSLDGGRGAFIDVSSESDIFIAGSGPARGSRPKGVLVLRSGVLSSWEAESLLIGGVRSRTEDGTTVAVKTGRITVDNHGDPLTGPEIILAARKKLTLARGAGIAQAGSLTDTPENLLVDGNGAFLRATDSPDAKFARTNLTADNPATLTLSAGATLTGASFTLDSSQATNLAPRARLLSDYLALNSGRISLALDSPADVAKTDGLVLGGKALRDLQGIEGLALLSYSSIDLYGAGSLRATEFLSLSAGEIRGFQTGKAGVTFTAPTITLDNRGSGARSDGGEFPVGGRLRLNADLVELGRGRVDVENFAAVQLNAASGLLLTATGALRVQNDLAVRTALVTAGPSVTTVIRAGGDLRITPSGREAAAGLAPGLGASLTLEGARVTAATDITLPSGTLNLHATEGDLNVGGRLDVNGVAQRFNDLTKYTDAGQIALSADAGDIRLSRGGVLAASAEDGGGNAGLVTLEAARGSLDLRGEIVAAAGKNGRGGSFVADVEKLADFAALNRLLNRGAFTESRAFRVRGGDVVIDGTTRVRHLTLSADDGSILVTGTVDASGDTGGSIWLAANGDLTLADGAALTVAGRDYDAAGKGGSITLEAGTTRDGVAGAGRLDLRRGSKLDLSVARHRPGSEELGQFTGTLHLRAPQLADGSDLQITALDGAIVGASRIVLEGYRVFDLSLVGGNITYTGNPASATTQPGGGLITSSSVDVQKSVREAGVIFGDHADAIKARLFGPDSGLAGRAIVAPGVEILNQTAAAPIPVTLTTSGGSTVAIPSSGGTVVLPQGTGDGNQLTSTRAGSIVTAAGEKIAIAANVPFTVPAGASLVFAPVTTTSTTATTIAFAAGGTGGPIALRLPAGATYAAGGASTGTVGTRGASVSLNTPGSSSVSLGAGDSVLFTAGTAGTRRITATVPLTIVTAGGATINVAANTPTPIAAGSTVTLGAAGRISYATGGSGTGAPTLTLLAGRLTTAGSVGLVPGSGDLTVGAVANNDANNWDLSADRFGPQKAPGVLTLRAGGNLTFLNGVSDGFKSAGYDAELLDANPLLPLNAQSWSYRFAAGADFTAADFRRVRPLDRLAKGSGSLLLGKTYANTFAQGEEATTRDAVTNRYQVIRTGSGDIEIAAARDVQIRNVFATIYTAGTRVADPTMGGKFDLPRTITSIQVQGSDLGVPQQSPGYVAQYSLGGGNLAITAGADIVTKYSGRVTNGVAADDAKRQLPNNWLYRRGFVDPRTGLYGVTPLIRSPLGGFDGGDVNSTSWWVDFSNFFEGVGALGGGNVSLIAGHDVTNVDAVIPTNARLPRAAGGASELVELGGGDLLVRSGSDIDAGVYYVERGAGILSAGGRITTNAARAISTQAFRSVPESGIPSEQAWLPTTLFLGKGRFDVSARGDVLLGPTANLFLLPEGLNNSIWYRTVFSTYAPTSEVSVTSLGGALTLRTDASISDFRGRTHPLLDLWARTQQRFSSTSASSFQPWLRLNETDVTEFQAAGSILPPKLRATAFSGDVNLAGNLTLAPASRGTLELVAAGSLNGLQPTGTTSFDGEALLSWAASRINVSDAAPSALPGVLAPYAARAFLGASGDVAAGAREAVPGYLDAFDALFDETGATALTSETKQALHAAGPLHAGDSEPLRLVARQGDISGLTLFSPKAARIVAGQDITDIAFYLQNVAPGDISVVAAGRDLTPFDANSPLRVLSRSAGNLPPGIRGGEDAPFAGDIQVSGPGTLAVLAGQNLDLGTGLTNADGTGAGITSVGFARNPYLPADGASLVVGAGIGPAAGLEASPIDFDAFVEKYLLGSAAKIDLAEIDPKLSAADLENLTAEQRDLLALRVFYRVLRDAGRKHTAADGTNGYADGFAAIATLFPDVPRKDGRPPHGDLLTRSRNIRTLNGGDISLLAPRGELTLANTTLGNPAVPPGIITESGGDISVFARNDVDIGVGRIFTLKGGDMIIWSSTGDIAAGAASKTVKSAPPTRALFDPQSADVQTDLAGLSTGGGIGVLATVEGVEPGDVDLIAPVGVVDAGDAGIRVSGNLNIAATAVLNASNITVAGKSSGVPSAPVVAAPNIAGLTSASSAAGAASSAANDLAKQARSQAAPDETPSDITVEVLGYGGGDDSASL